MDTSLRIFISQFVGAVAVASAPAILVAFLSIPFTLGGHPGEMRPTDVLVGLHLT